jgi:hypothetical protein
LTRFRRFICGCAAAACLVAAGADAASARTFYVDGRGESTTCLAPTREAACPTIDDAILSALLSPPPNTIEVAPDGPTVSGAYEETLELENVHNNGLTINGEEAGVEVVVHGADPAVSTVGAAGTLSLSNLKVKDQGGDPGAVIEDRGATLTLDNVDVENESTSGVNGIAALKQGSLSGSVTIDGGSISMENGASGYAVSGVETPLALHGVTILNGSGSPAEAGGVLSERSTLAIESSHIGIEEGLLTQGRAVNAVKDTSVSLQKDSVRQSNSKATGVSLEGSSTSVNGLGVEMLNPASTAFALTSVQLSGNSTLSHLEVGGTWRGPGLIALGPGATISDSRIASGGSSAAPALLFGGSGESTGLVLQRTVLQAPAAAAEGALFAEGANVTLDSSEVLGGANGVTFENKQPGTRTLTVSASTIDAGAPGIAADALGINGIFAQASTEPGTAVTVAVQGSIVLEKQVAQAETGDQANIGCAYSAVPSQAQAASGATGAIACGSGTNGNREANPLSALFAEPLTSYQLTPSSSLVGAVPAGALSLPFGLVPSASDLAGHPRTGDGDDACFTGQDMGALELQGHLVSCPAPPAATTTTASTPKPVAGAISALTISPGAFLAAPSGATVSAATAATRKKYGSKISYRDSQVATTTFTVLRPTNGRMQGRSCKKPSKKNKHGRRCTLYVQVGSFTHIDKAAANSFHFSGRLRGRRLAPGSYRLQAIAHDAAGNGRAVDKSFTIK